MSDPEEAIEPLLARTPLRYQLVPHAREIADKHGISGFPTHLVLDTKGIVRYAVGH